MSPRRLVVDMHILVLASAIVVFVFLLFYIILTLRIYLFIKHFFVETKKFIIKGSLNLCEWSITLMVCVRFCQSNARGSNTTKNVSFFGAHRSKITTRTLNIQPIKDSYVPRGYVNRFFLNIIKLYIFAQKGLFGISKETAILFSLFTYFTSG